MSALTRWQTTRARMRRMRRQLTALAGKPMLGFTDLSNNNKIHKNGIERYARNHNLIALKATEGRTYKDSAFPRLVAEARKHGLLVLPYHFARPDNNTPEAEARHFVETCRAAGLHMGKRRRLWYERTNLPGCLDYEVNAPGGADVAWINRFTVEYQRLTGHGRSKWRGKRPPATAGPILYGGAIVRESLGTRSLGMLYWLAAYTPTAKPYWPAGLQAGMKFAWQYTDKHKIPELSPRGVDYSAPAGKITVHDLLSLAV